MPQPSVSVEPAGSHPAASEIYRWEVSGKPIAVEIRLDALDRLDREVTQAFRAITSRGSEVGGILLGRFRAQPRPTVVIEDYEAVPCDYRRGPLYLLADADRARLEETLARWRNQPPRDLTVVGYYRSNTRKELALDDDDLALIEQYFRDPHQVVLLIKPFASKPNLAGFFLWEGDAVPRQSALTFPFNRAELVKSGAVAAAAAPEPAARAAAAPARVPLEIRIAVPGEPPTPAAPPAKPEAPPPKAAKPPESAAAAAAATADGKAGTPVTARPEADRKSPAPAAAPPAKPSADGRAAAAAPAREAAAPGSTALVAKPSPATGKPAEQPKPAPEAKPVAKSQPVTAPEAQAAPTPAAESAAASAVPAFASLGVKAAEAETTAPTKKRKLWIPVAALLLLVIAGLFLWWRSRPTGPVSAPDASALGLRVERSGGQLLLSWNRSLPLLQTAQRAILTISDGDHREDVEMDLGQLRSGSIVYSPITSDVSFRLEVTDLKNGKSVSESVRVLGGKPSPAGPPADAARAATSNAAPTPSAPESAKPQPRAMVPPPNPARGESLAARLSPVEPIPAAQPPKVELPVSAAKPAVPMPSEPKPEAAAPAPAASQPVAQVIQPASNPKPETPAPPPSAAPKPVENPPAASAAKPVPPQPAAAQTSEQPIRVGGQVQEAKLIKRKDPVYPPLARQARLQGVVRLQAVIGPDGRVEQVEAVSGPPLLRQAAIDAVKQWVYQPSLLNGRPVRVTTQIEINFTLGGR